jgi:hypothetical protein
MYVPPLQVMRTERVDRSSPRQSVFHSWIVTRAASEIQLLSRDAPPRRRAYRQPVSPSYAGGTCMISAGQYARCRRRSRRRAARRLRA